MNSTNITLFQNHLDILDLRELKQSTIETYASYMTQYINWVEESLNNKALSDVTWEELRSYVRLLRDVRNLNPRTINYHIAQLRDFYLYILHREWDRYQVPTLHFDEPLPLVPTRKEVEAIINAMSHNKKHKAELALLYSSGMRVSEMCALRCKDILRSKKCIRIVKPKNRKDRYAILSDRALAILCDYIRDEDATLESWLFAGQVPGTHICTETIRNVMKRALVRAGMADAGYTPKSLRHAFGLHLYEAGTDLMSIKEAMGHKSLSSTTVYLSLGIGNGRQVTSPYDFD